MQDNNKMQLKKADFTLSAATWQVSQNKNIQKTKNKHMHCLWFWPIN